MSKKQQHVRKYGAHHAKAQRQHELEERERRRAQRTNVAKRLEFFSEDL